MTEQLMKSTGNERKEKKMKCRVKMALLDVVRIAKTRSRPQFFFSSDRRLQQAL